MVTDPAHWNDEVIVPLAAWEIWQSYLTPAGAPLEVRLRLARRIEPDTAGSLAPRAVLDDDGAESIRRLLTVKQTIETDDASSGEVRHEIEVEVDDEQFRDAWAISPGSQLKKIRVEYMAGLQGGHRVVLVDTFQEHLAGLVLAEVEFAEQQASDMFEPPGFLGLEVTDDPRFKNANLARAPSPPQD